MQVCVESDRDGERDQQVGNYLKTERQLLARDDAFEGNHEGRGDGTERSSHQIKSASYPAIAYTSTKFCVRRLFDGLHEFKPVIVKLPVGTESNQPSSHLVEGLVNGPLEQLVETNAIDGWLHPYFVHIHAICQTESCNKDYGRVDDCH